MEAKLAWKRSGKTIVGTVDLDIPDLSHLALPLVATCRKRTGFYGESARPRVWRGDVENGTWVKLHGPLALSGNEGVDQYEKLKDASLATQLDTLLGVERQYDTHVTESRVLDRVRLPGIDLQHERKRTKIPLREVQGEREILAHGGAEALAFARWSASLYAVMDGELWRRHPGPWFHTRERVDGATEACLVGTLTFGGHNMDVNRAARWDTAVFGPHDDVEMEIHSNAALETFDDDAMTLEKITRVIRHTAGLKRVQDLSPVELRTIATLSRLDDGHPIAALRNGDVNDWPYDPRRFDFPFRAEIVEPLKQVYDLLRPDIHVSYRARIDAILRRMADRAARTPPEVELTEDDREALEGLPTI